MIVFFSPEHENDLLKLKHFTHYENTSLIARFLMSLISLSSVECGMKLEYEMYKYCLNFFFPKDVINLVGVNKFVSTNFLLVKNLSPQLIHIFEGMKLLWNFFSIISHSEIMTFWCCRAQHNKCCKRRTLRTFCHYRCQQCSGKTQCAKVCQQTCFQFTNN